MGVMMQPVMLAKGNAEQVLKSLQADPIWQKAQAQGLEHLNLYVSPDDPASATIVSRWASAEHAAQFHKKYGAKAYKAAGAKANIAGEPQIMGSVHNK